MKGACDNVRPVGDDRGRGRVIMSRPVGDDRGRERVIMSVLWVTTEEGGV